MKFEPIFNISYTNVYQKIERTFFFIPDLSQAVGFDQFLK